MHRTHRHIHKHREPESNRLHNIAKTHCYQIGYQQHRRIHRTNYIVEYWSYHRFESEFDRTFNNWKYIRH